MTIRLDNLRLYLLAFVATLFFPLWYFRTKKNIGETPRILVIPQSTRIGDLVCATPLLGEIKKKYPKSFLSVAVNKKVAGVIINNPYIDEVFILEDEEYLEFFGLIRRFKRIREKHFDVSVCVSGASAGTMLSVYGMIPRRIKVVRNPRSFSEKITDWMNTDTVCYRVGDYLPELYLTTLKYVGIEMPKKINKEVFTSQESNVKAETFLKEHHLSPDDLIVGFSVTAGNKIKEWRLSKFGVLAQELIKKYNAKIIFTGSPNDKEEIDTVNKVIDNKGINSTDTFSLEEQPSLIQHFDIFISADTGVTHIADGLGVPLIDIVGPVDPTEQAPRGETSVVVRPPQGIEPTIFAFRPAGNIAESKRAVEETSVDEVVKAFDTLYSKIYA